MLRDHDKESLLALFPRQQIFVDPIELVAYETDAGIGRGIPDAVVFPRSASEVAQLARWSHEHYAPLIARGGGTCLSGGPIPERGGIIVEFSLMNRILQLDCDARSAVVEAGLLNLVLDETVRREGLYFPPDPSSQRASTIGGNVAENAGGAHCFKYGVTTNYVTGLEVTLTDGARVRMGGAAFDYPEFDLRGLLVGSEGTLGLITSVDVRLIGNPPAVKTMMVAFDSVEQAGEAVSAIIAAGLVPAAMEMMDQKFVRIAEDYAHAGLPTDAGALLIIEVDGYPASLSLQIEEIRSVLTANGGRDMRFANTAEERDKIWYARKSVPGAVSRLAPAYYLVDITVPRSRLAHTLEQVDAICERLGLRVGYLLHAGDGNLHPMILVERPDDATHMALVHKAAAEIVQIGLAERGTLTGEHGIGNEKREFMPLMFTPDELSAMWDVKHVFDPDQLFNPGKILPSLPNHTRESPTTRAVNSNLLAPTCAEEAAGLLATLSAGQRRVRIGNESGGDGAVRMASTNLHEVIEYAPDDLYVTVGAGMRLADLQNFLAPDRRWLPVASPWPLATVGGVIAGNVNAPLRMRYGSVRDLILALTIALADGRVLHAGRPVIKNVAGYDLQKVFIGSHGALGFIAEATLRLLPEPRDRQTLTFEIEDLSDALAIGMQVVRKSLVSSGVVVHGDSGDRILLACTAEGLAQDVEAELAEAKRTIGRPERVGTEALEPSATGLWLSTFESRGLRPLILRAGIPAKRLAEYVEAVKTLLSGSCFTVDVGSSLLYTAARPSDLAAAQAWLEQLRAPALALGGYAIVMELPEEWRSGIEPWGLQPDAIGLMRALKTKWDPNHILVSELYDI